MTLKFQAAKVIRRMTLRAFVSLWQKMIRRIYSCFAVKIKDHHKTYQVWGAA